MSSVKFKKDNLLNYDSVKIQTSNCTEIFAFYTLEQGEPMSPIDSEINAIQKTEDLKQLHRERGILKNDRFYYYFKLQVMALNDAGLKRTKDHVFRDSKGKSLVRKSEQKYIVSSACFFS